MKKLIHGLIIGVVAAAAAIVLHFSGLIYWIEARTWDWRVQKYAEPSTSTEQITVIMVDQYSMDWAEEKYKIKWPWPRQVYAYILDACREAGAKCFAFDSIITEASIYGDDQLLGDAIRDTQPCIMALNVGEGKIAEQWPEDLLVNDFKPVGSDKPARKSVVKESASFPPAEISTNVTMFATISGASDHGARVRRSVPFETFDGKFLPNLGLASYLSVNPGLPFFLSDDLIKVGDRKIPLDKSGHAILNFRGPEATHNSLSAAAVIQTALRIKEGKEPSIDLDLLKDKYIFLGTSADGMLDNAPMPLDDVYPGVGIHATFLDNLLEGDFFRDAAAGEIILLCLIAGLMAGISGRLCRNAWQLAAVSCLLLPLPLIPGCIAYSHSVWLPIASPLSSLAMGLVAAGIVNYAIEGKQKRFIKGAFGQYLSPVFVDRLLKHPENLKLGGEARVLSIYFSDVQGFTTISESLTPQSLTALLNDYLTEMATIIFEEGGTIDKYEGDAVIAFWNAPLDDPAHPRNAVRAALRGQKKLKELRLKYREEYGKDIHARIGINTGEVVVGNMGSVQRFDYTFLGDAGNLAARLEGINKQFGTFVLISEYTAAQLGDEFVLKELSKVRVVGKNEPVTVFEPILKEDADHEALNAFNAALQLYYKGDFIGALDAFKALPDDPTAERYVLRCEKLADEPPDPWEGVWIMTEK